MSPAQSVFATLAQDSTIRGNERADAHRARSAARSLAAWNDAATATELWADATAWSTGTVIAAAGKLQGNNGGAASGINRAFPVKSGERARILFSVTSPADMSSARMIVGLSSDAPGATATAGGASAIGFSFNGLNVRSWGAAGGEATLGPMSGAWTWYITFTVDSTLISGTAVRSDGNVEYRMSWTRAFFPNINNLFVFNSSNTASNTYVGPVGARKGIATLSPRLGIEDQQRTVQWTNVADGTNNMRIALPQSYDSRVATPLVIAAHSLGNTETLYADDTQGKLMCNAFLKAGYMVLSTLAPTTPVGTEFGNQALLDSTVAAYKYVRDHYNIGSVFSYGISMGGLASLLIAIDPRVPGIKAWAGSSPICSLANAYSRSDAGWDTYIKAAYGLASDGSDYAALTAGHDPLLQASKYAGLPMLAVASPADTAVTKVANTDAMATAVNALPGGNMTVIPVTGAHNDAAQYPAATIVAHFDRYA